MLKTYDECHRMGVVKVAFSLVFFYIHEALSIRYCGGNMVAWCLCQ